MTPRVRCAIYTRKSTEEGLDQDFNSLDAQREACEAYVKSQRGMGWSALTNRYDDGGISGGTLERPALQMLLTDIDEGKVDLVVVYKVDRLTRSLADFAKIVERFEARGASFVSVTQQFNTSTSMGRLTLNVLLSFAQFEREVTGERIRDKIAASKKKGMWMGGLVPLGYDLDDRKLVINPTEAKVVRTLFKLYLDLGSVNALLHEANQRAIKTKQRVNSEGQVSGSQSFTRGHLYQLLANPLYVGEVAHKGQNYPGQHKAIIDRKTFDAVQAQLSGNATNRRSATNTDSQSLLTGMIYDESGERLCPIYTNKRGQRYRYYVSKRLVSGAAYNKAGWRLPATELERAVAHGLTDYLKDERRLISGLNLRGLRPDRMHKLLARTNDTAIKVFERDTLTTLVQRIDVTTDAINIALKRDVLLRMIAPDSEADLIDSDTPLIVEIPMQLRRRGVEAKLIIAGNTSHEPDAALVSAIARAHAWWQDLSTNKVMSINELGARDNVDASDISRLLPLAFLAPDIVGAILSGQQPVSLTMYSLKRLSGLPMDWQHQRQVLGFNG